MHGSQNVDSGAILPADIRCGNILSEGHRVGDAS